jgi:IS30 family transposase
MIMKHLDLVQRSKIQALHEQGLSCRQIASQINVNHSTVSRELKRNSVSGPYDANAAQQLAQSRHTQKPKHRRFIPCVESTIKALIHKDYSPEQIVGHCRVIGVNMVSHERIYQYLWNDKRQGGTLYTHLRHRGRRRRKRGNKKHTRSNIPNRIDITERPPIVEQKSRVGDLEIDTIIGQNRRGAIVTINDRLSGYLWAELIPIRSAQWTAEVTIKELSAIKNVLHTITADNGLEFAQHQQIAKALDIDFFFAHPYKSCQRGANENLNGLLRQYIPKKTDFSTISKKQLQSYCDKLNSRPRKRHGFKTPTFILHQHLNTKVLHL